jgi:toxin-antitoxin system PIN domain toxin
MPMHLLDVNVLVALGWPSHQHHASAHRWFSSAAAGGQGGWATCPLTQCGFVRISTNPKAVGAALTPAQAVAAIARMTTHERHVFWADDLPVASAYFPAAALQGHQQISLTARPDGLGRRPLAPALSPSKGRVDEKPPADDPRRAAAPT